MQELAGIKMSQATNSDANGKGGFSPVQLFVLRCILKDFSREWITAAVERAFTVDSAENLQQEVEALLHFLRHSILKSLLFEPTTGGGEVLAKHQVTS